MFKILFSALIILLFFMSTPSYSAIDSFEFETKSQQQLFHDLSKQLRCPKCQNQNILDSNSELAKDLRNKTYELVKKGQSEEQIVDYMVARFGNFVRYDPPMTPATIFLWLSPLIFILLGLYFLYAQIRKQNVDDEQLDEQEILRLQKILVVKETENRGKK